VLNQFDETRDAVSYELLTQRLQVSSRLKQLTEMVEKLEKKAKSGVKVNKKEEYEPLKDQLFELKAEQMEKVVGGGFNLMYKLGALVEKEREEFKDLHYESKAAGGKLAKY